MEQPTQTTLLPLVHREGDVRVVALDALPEDAMLRGDPPARSMIESVRALGVLHPIILIDTEHGYEIAAGRNRIKAARAAGLTTIGARVFPHGYVNAAVLTLVENEQRRANPLADLHALEQLLATGADEHAIFRATGMAAPVIRARLKLANLQPALRQALEQGAIRVSVAQDAARLGPVQQARLVERLASAGRLTAKDVIAASRAQAADVVDQLPMTLFTEPSPSDRVRGAIAQLRTLAGDDPVSSRLLDELEQHMCPPVARSDIA